MEKLGREEILDLIPNIYARFGHPDHPQPIRRRFLVVRRRKTFQIKFPSKSFLPLCLLLFKTIFFFSFFIQYTFCQQNIKKKLRTASDERSEQRKTGKCSPKASKLRRLSDEMEEAESKPN